MATPDLYQQAHLWVAAIRILEYQHQMAPTMGALCELLDVSIEHGHRLVRKLESRGIIQSIVKGEEVRCAIADHRLLEDLPQLEAQLPPLSAEVAKFKSARSEIAGKVESFRSEQDRKQKDLFAELNAKLKADLSGKS